MSWDQICEMARGNIDFGSHTHTHPMLIDLSEGQIREELTVSKNLIEKATGKTVNSLAYPNGEYLPEIFPIVADCGYKSAFTTEIGPNKVGDCLFKLRRRDSAKEYTGFFNKFSIPMFCAEMLGIGDYRQKY